MKEGVFVHAFITEQIFKKEVSENTTEGVNVTQTDNQDEKLGFDRLLQNNAYSEIEVHAIRL